MVQNVPKVVRFEPFGFPAEPTVLVGPSEGEDPSRVAVGLVHGICDKHPK